MLSTIIVDRHPLTRLAIRTILEKHQFSILGESDDGLQAISMIKERSPDIIITDIDLNKISGIELVENIRKNFFDKTIIVTAAQNDIFYGKQSAKAGANGFVRKKDFLTNVIECINATRNGYSYFPFPMMMSSTDMSHEQNILDLLSIQEIKVMEMLLIGSRNKEIASKMSISDKTVSTYKKRLFKKLGCNTCIDLIKFADRNNL